MMQIQHRVNGQVLFQVEAGDLRSAVEAAVRAGANLRGANLGEADLRGANLWGANCNREKKFAC